MKALVQYNDITGTAAADLSDHTNLNDFLVSRGVNTTQYEAIGASFHSNYNDSFTATIICVDKEQSTNENKYITEISFENEFSKDEFFSLFKRINVVISQNSNDHEQEINEKITFDDRNNS